MESKESFFRLRGGRLFSVLAVLIVIVFLAGGVLLATNYKHLGNLVKVVTLVRTQSLQPVDATQLVDGAIKGMVGSLNDPYSVYLDPKTFAQLNEQIKGSFGGLGILVGVKEQYLTVVRAYQGTPAAKAGIVAGDVISKIDDHDAEGIDLETAISLMRGEVGSKVTLTIDRKEITEPMQFTRELIREEISVPTVESQVLPNTAIGYAVISQFTEHTSEEMKENLAKLQKEQVKGLILDLRDNPGGELVAAVNVAKNYIPKGPIVFIDYRFGRDQEFSSEGRTAQLPLVVLINGGSASAAEILAGAVKDTGAGTLVGTKSFGKGIVQTVFPLSNGAGLKLTTARYLTPNRSDIHEKGILPDVLVQPGENDVRDIQLDRAIELIKQKIAG
ncbi:MAG: S41 family peptidase [Desulfotomaculaceae bacterium]|nr:S41 family peptidase [Desulfotomaculaceae bacterium]